MGGPVVAVEVFVVEVVEVVSGSGPLEAVVPKPSTHATVDYPSQGNHRVQTCKEDHIFYILKFGTLKGSRAETTLMQFEISRARFHHAKVGSSGAYETKA